MKILAFLQNMWARNPESFRGGVARHGEAFRRRAVTYCLFAGCLTGRRLKDAFGERLCRQIVWEEASPEIADNARTVCKPDHAHIRQRLEEERPDIVLAFGSVAGAALAGLWHGMLICAPHPAARQPETVARLEAAAGELRTFMEARAI